MSCDVRDERYQQRAIHCPSAFSTLFSALSALDQNGSSFPSVTVVTEMRRRKPSNEEADRYRGRHHAR